MFGIIAGFYNLSTTDCFKNEERIGLNKIKLKISILRDRIRFFLFGARKPEKNIILENKPPYDNFLAVCSLPFFRPRSIATQQLTKILHMCKLHSQQKEIRDLKPIEQLQDIAVLQLIKLALHQWCKDREKVSTRIAKVRQLAELMQAKQRSIVTYYNNYYPCYIEMEKERLAFMYRNRLSSNQSPLLDEKRLPSLTDCNWKNAIHPFLNIDLRDYLSAQQRLLFGEFSKDQAPLPMHSKFCAAFFMPLIQCISDVDSVDLMWEYFSMYFNAGVNFFATTPLFT